MTAAPQAPLTEPWTTKILQMAPWLPLRWPGSGCEGVTATRIHRSLPAACGGVYVSQNQFAIASLSTPLATDSLKTCAALFVANHHQGIHYLSHLDAAHSRSEIRDSLSGISLQEAQINIRPGFDPSALQTVQRILQTLRAEGVSMKQIAFLREAGIDGIATYQQAFYQVDYPNLWEHPTTLYEILQDVSPRGPWPWRHWQERMLNQ